MDGKECVNTVAKFNSGVCNLITSCIQSVLSRASLSASVVDQIRKC